MMNHPVMIKTLKNTTHESIVANEPNVSETLFYVISSLTRDQVPVVQPDVFGFGVVGGWGFQLKFFPTPKNQRSEHFLLFLQHNLLFSQSNGWKFSRT